MLHKIPKTLTRLSIVPWLQHELLQTCDLYNYGTFSTSRWGAWAMKPATSFLNVGPNTREINTMHYCVVMCILTFSKPTMTTLSLDKAYLSLS